MLTLALSLLHILAAMALLSSATQVPTEGATRVALSNAAAHATRPDDVAREAGVAYDAESDDWGVYVLDIRRDTRPNDIWFFPGLNPSAVTEAWFTLTREWEEYQERSGSYIALRDGWMYEVRQRPLGSSEPHEIWRRPLSDMAAAEIVFELPREILHGVWFDLNDTHFYVSEAGNHKSIWRFPVDDPESVTEPWHRRSRYWPSSLQGAIAVDDEHLYMAAGWSGEWIWRFPLDDPGAAALWRDLGDPQRFEFKTWAGRTEYEEGAITDLALSERHLWLLINRSYGPDVIWRLELDDPEAGPALWLELPILTDWTTTSPEPPISGSVHGIAIGPWP